MNEDDKYYVPDIEDFRIGYEYEKSNDENKSEWRVEIKDWDFEGLDFYLREGMIRVPYLTHEQIKNEGWTYTPDFNHYYKNIDDEKGYGIDFFEDYMIISDCGEPIFRGIIKSINEFRYISKLLKI